MKSEWEITLRDARTGAIKQQIPWHKNTILDVGMNAILTMSKQIARDSTYGEGFFPYIAVGSGGTEPSTTDTGLETQVLRKLGTQADSVNYNITDPASPYCIIGVTFIESEANGDLREVGLCTAASGGTFFNRDLFKDQGGNPATITKTSNDLLTVKCKITAKRVSETPSSYDVTASDSTVHAVKSIVTNAGLVAFLVIRSGPWNIPPTLRTGTGATDPDPADTGIQVNQMVASVSGVWGAAHTGPDGGFYREMGLLANPSDCNQNIAEVCPGWGQWPVYDNNNQPFHSRFTFSPALAKTSAKKLILTMRVTLSRL